MRSKLGRRPVSSSFSQICRFLRREFRPYFLTKSPHRKIPPHTSEICVLKWTNGPITKMRPHSKRDHPSLKERDSTPQPVGWAVLPMFATGLQALNLFIKSPLYLPQCHYPIANHLLLITQFHKSNGEKGHSTSGRLTVERFRWLSSRK